jgi:uncharacterized membrane protein YphA (DoxX/SURF4 family)
METYYEPFVYLVVRVVLGSMFFFQAYDKVFRIGLPNVSDEVCEGCNEKGIPKWYAKASVYVSSYIELTGGILLIFGLITLPTLFLFGIHLMLVSVAFGYLRGLWDSQHVFPRLVMLIFLFLLPNEWNIFSLDNLF